MSGSRPLDRGSSVEQDSRGILTPGLFRRRTSFTRYAPEPPLEGLVDWFWAIRWDLPTGLSHCQQVLQHPAVNLSVCTPDARTGRRAIEARVTGTATDLVDRELRGRGWVIAMKTTVGGFGAFVDVPLSDLVDRVVEVDEAVPGLCGEDLVRDVIAAGPDDGPAPAGPAPGDPAPDDDPARCPRAGTARDRGADGDPGPHDEAREPSRVAVLARALEGVLDRADPGRVEAAREVAAIARIAESDRSVRRVDDLAARAGVSPRALQRMFARHVGVSPTWVVRRYRLLEAAETVRGGERVVWAEVANALGYADQAHLVRDFRGALGRTPEAYARALR